MDLWPACVLIVSPAIHSQSVVASVPRVRGGCTCGATAPAVRVVVCDGCTGEFHWECMEPPWEAPPEGKWFGPCCGSSGPESSAIVGCQVCRQVGVDDHITLLCDMCDAEYHMYCLVPPLKRLPRGDWHCPGCSQKQPPARRRRRVTSFTSSDDDDDDDRADSDDDDDFFASESSGPEAGPKRRGRPPGSGTSQGRSLPSAEYANYKAFPPPPPDFRGDHDVRVWLSPQGDCQA